MPPPPLTPAIEAILAAAVPTPPVRIRNNEDSRKIFAKRQTDIVFTPLL
jgi:hypothetical protein